MLLRPCRPLLARQPNGSLPLSLHPAAIPTQVPTGSLLDAHWMPTGGSWANEISPARLLQTLYLLRGVGDLRGHLHMYCTCLQDMQLSHTCLRDHFEIVHRSECDLSRRSSFPRTPPPVNYSTLTVILSNIYPNQALLSPTNLPERIAFVTTRYSAMSIYKNPTRPIPPGPYFPYIRITELPG